MASEANYLSVVKKIFENPTDPTKVQAGLLRITQSLSVYSLPKNQNQKPVQVDGERMDRVITRK